MQNRLLPLLMSFVCLLYIPGAYDSLKHILSRQATVMIWLSIVVFVAVVAGYGFLPFFLSGYLPSHFSGLSSSWTWKRPLFIEDINYCLPKNGIQIAVSKFLWFGVLNQDLIGTEEHKKAGWCGIGIYGLKLKLPVSFLQAQRQKPASTTLSETSTPTPTTPKLSRSNDATRKNRDLEKDEDIAMQTHLRGRRRSPLRARMNMMKRHLRYAIPRRILRFANWLGRTFAFVLGWFSFELVDFSLEVEGLGTLVIEKARIGVELKRSKENHVMGWLKLEGVKVVECATTTKAICFNLPRWVKLEFTAPLDPTVGLGGLFTPAGLKPASVNVNLEFGKQPFEIQVDKVKKALEAFGEKMESLVGQSAAVPLLNSLQLPTPKVSDAKQDRLSKASDASFETIWEDEDLLDQSTILQEATKRHQPLPPKHLRNFLRAIREVQLKLPRINLFVSHYPSADPLPESAWPRECPRPELPRSIEFRVEGDGIALVLRRGVKVKGSAQGEWFGGEDILTTVDASMSSVEVRLSLDDKPESDSFHLGSSSFSLSSNWFPTQMKRFFAPTERTQQEPLFQGDPNSHLIVGELEVGTMSGKCNMQELEAVNWGLAVRSYRYKARRQERDAGRQSEGDAHPAHLTPTLAEELLAGLPRIIGCVKLNTFSYTVIGRDEWRGDRLHISLSESTFNVQTSYRDSFARSVMNHDGSSSRSEASKKAVPKAVRVKRFSAVDFHDKRHHTLMYRVDGEVTIGLFSVSMEALPIAPRTEQRSYFQTRRHRSKQDILTFGPLEYRVFQDITGWEEYDSLAGHDIPILDLDTIYGETKCLAHVVTVDFWHPSALRAYRDALDLLTTRPFLETQQDLSVPLMGKLPRDQYFHLSLAQATVRLAKEDPKEGESMVRGIKLESRNILLEYLFSNKAVTGMESFHIRGQLDLKDDIRVSASGHANSYATSRIPKAFFQLAVAEANVVPVLDARVTDKSLRDATLKDMEEVSHTVGDRPKMARKVTAATQAILEWKRDEEKLKSSLLYFRNLEIPFSFSKQSEAMNSATSFLCNLESSCLISRITLADIYFAMIALTAFDRNLPKERKKRERGGRESEVLGVNISAKCRQIDVVLQLDDPARLYLQLTNVDLVFRKPAHPKSLSELNLKCTTALLAGFSPTVSEGFDDLIRTHDLNIRLQQQVLKFDASVIRLRIPYKFILADSIEAIVNMVKCIKQMSQRVFNKRQNWTIDPIPEVPKKVPRIDVNIPTVILEFEDDPFENALNIIWQAGFQEQRARSARAEQLHECLRQLESWYPQDFDKGKLRDEHWREEFDLKAAEDNARTWKARVDRMRQQQDEGDIKPPVLKLRAKADVLVPMRKPPRTTPLARLTVTDFAVRISPPHFDQPGGVGVDGFLHEVGKGMPADTLFNLVIPFHLDWSASSVTCTLRDFPLPLLEIPSTGVLSTPAWELSTDFVIAEEHGPPSSVRWASSTIVPASGCTDMRDHSMKVPRTAMPTKTYMVPSVRVNSKNVTRIGWGNSMHPTIQDVVRVLDSLTHASPDQSEKLAFWDKIRLVLHWRVEIKFAGPVYLHLKGSRDPYHLSGFGAGFVLAWMDDTIIRLGQPDSLKKHHEFLEVQSDRFVLAIPDLSHYSKGQSGVKTNPLSRERDDHRVSISPSASSNEDFGLVCLRLIGGVRWGMGVVPERTCRDGSCEAPQKCVGSTFHRQCRLFHFKPHYHVVTSTQSLPSGFDSFQSFRSDFIHFSISLSALKGTAPNPSDRTGENNCQYNALHLTPEGMTHFFAWWKLFDGTLSLPIRQGSKFPGSAESAKFGRHCGTIKYSFRLAPIFVSHTFRQEDDKDWAQGVTTVLGLKGRMESLRVDLHQRMQEECVHREARKEHVLVMRKPFYYAEVNCKEIDLRLINASFHEPERSQALREDVPNWDMGVLEDVNSSRETDILREDEPWWEMEDYNELGYEKFTGRFRSRQILKVLTAPRFTFYKHLPNREDEDDAESILVSKFGDEPTHSCLVDENYEIFLQACQSDQERADEFRTAAKALEEELNDPKLKGGEESAKKAEREKLKEVGQQWIQKTQKNDSMKKRLAAFKSKLGVLPVSCAPILFTVGSGNAVLDSYDQNDEKSWWHNQYYFVEPRVRIDNQNRAVLLQYAYSLSDRKASQYHTAPAVIKDLGRLRPTDRRRHRTRTSRHRSRIASRSKSIMMNPFDLQTVLQGLAGSATKVASVSDSRGKDVKSFHEVIRHDPESDANADLPEDWDLVRSHFFRLTNPQILLQSERSEGSRLILSIAKLDGRVFSVVDTNAREDAVHSLVLHRSYVTLDALQVFFPTFTNRPHWEGNFIPSDHLYESRGGMQDAEDTGLKRVVPMSFVGLRYDKFNQLRISKSFVQPGTAPSNEHLKRGVDRLIIDADRLSVRSTPDDFQGLYDVLTNLILHPDDERKQYTDQLQTDAFKISLNDELEELIRRVQTDQADIRQLTDALHEERKKEKTAHNRMLVFLAQHRLLRSIRELDRRIRTMNFAGSLEGLSMEQDKSASGLQLDARAPEIEWSMNTQEDKPIAKFTMKGVYFAWANKQQSITNRLAIKDLTALDTRSDSEAADAGFREIISKLEHAGHPPSLHGDIFAYLFWETLPSVGGITVYKHFEMHLHPVKLQLEHQIGSDIFDYILKPKPPAEKLTEPKRKTGFLKSIRNNLHIPSANSSPESIASLQSNKSLSIRSGRSGNANSIYSSSSYSSSDLGIGRWSKSRTSFEIPQGDPMDEVDPGEMRSRALQYKSFANVEIVGTTINLSYKPLKKASGYSLPELRDITYISPHMEFRHKVCTFGELFTNIQKDVKDALWDQKYSLLGQAARSLISKAPNVNALGPQLQPKKRLLGLGKPSGSSEKERRREGSDKSFMAKRSRPPSPSPSRGGTTSSDGRNMTDEEKSRIVLGR
ncbi:hypothetical protein BT69DRAFT_216657 [Atractiella rhizophila]|nr:hypothetical protein BT69DRAFT_216657 [Atractiella rhizophila]